MKTIWSDVVRVFSLAALVGLVVGCGKSGEEDPTLAMQATDPSERTRSAALDRPAAALQSLRDTEAALKAKDFEKAAASLLQMQLSSKPLTAEESIAQSGKMRDLQSQLAEAAASGDPRAQAAIRLLRSSRSAR
ncbi:MAG: hypothetical protein EXS30_11500 [Pedosphaera sp.]|nr:hypothetical protein [Pedosphaera sp.]